MTIPISLKVSESCPATAAEALARWDAGETVWTVEMGGLGPGYEQAIHVTAFEIVRELLTRTPEALAQCYRDADEDSTESRKRLRAFADAVEAAVLPRLKGLGLSGAQWGVACNLAYRTVRVGWHTALSDPVVADRLIQVSREWPRLGSEI